MRLTRQPASIALAALLITATVSAVERSAKWWSDNLAGPDSSSYVDLDQIKKSNVAQSRGRLDVPYAAAGFNPIVVDDVVSYVQAGTDR